MLPDGWIACELSDLGNVVTGKTPSTKVKDNFGGNIPFIKPGDLDHGGVIKQTANTLSEAGLQSVPAIPANSIPVTCIGNLGKVGITTQLSATNQQINTLIPHTDLSTKYLYYQACTLKPWLESESSATTVAIINKGRFSKAPIRLAPLTEQKIIAQKLDTLLAQVESTKARLERTRETLKRFRQSVLAAAVSGKLTEEWRGSASYLSTPLGLSKSKLSLEVPCKWTIQKLSDACEVVSGNAFKSKDFVDVGVVPAIKISNVQYGEFLEKNQQYLPDDYLERYKAFLVESGNVLMALTRPITNDTLKVCRYPKGNPVGLLNQRVCMFHFRKDSEKFFLETVFQSEYFKAQVADNLSETLQPNLSPKNLKNFLIAMPDHAEQTEIVRRVEHLFTHADTIEKQTEAALTRVNNLTQSILAKAFRGELTAQWRAENPELISGENSAEALLAKIKAEHATLTTKKGGKPRTPKAWKTAGA